jgi:uncharacterized protein YjdB
MQLNIRSVLSIVLLVATTSLTACGVNIDPDESAEQPRSTSAMLEAGQEAAGRAAGQELARAMARSLREPAMRGLVRAALAQSLVKEEKVHFNSYVRGPGRALLQSMSRQSGRSEAGLEELLAQAGSLEMYFPVKEHRAAWRGGEDLLVASVYRDHEAPLGFNLAGNPVTLSAKEPPATATLVLVPAEDFTADGTPTGRGLSLGRGGQRTQVSQELSTTATDMRGVYVKYVEIPGDYEGWARGEPEYEFYLERFQGGRQQLRCAGADGPSPFQWNMDGKTWSTPFLIGWESELPSDAGFAMFLYEDDDIPCVVNNDKDYVKLTLDALKAGNSAYTALQKRQSNKPLISFSHGMVESKSINSGGDEYVGTVSSKILPIDTTEREFTVVNQNLQTTATVKLQWRTFLSSIAITPATASVPEGRTQQFTATGTYRDGTTRDLTDSVTWTSSGSSIATVDSAGLVTGRAAGGTVTLTATQDSVSGSAQLTVTPAVVTSLTVTPATASINVGATQQFTATGTLSNNTTADLTSSVTWTSSNTAAVTVDASGLASGITAGPATIMATHSGVSGTASLSVECPSPSAMCSESCVHLPTDPNNCGACGNVCAQGEGCANSLCVNTGNLGISLSWDRPGDGDLHVMTSTGKLINHKNKGPSASTDYGQLDRDDATGTGPENIYWASGFTPPSGTYHVCGHPYSFGDTAPVTFTAMIRVPGKPTITLTKTLKISASPICAPGSESYMGSFSYP